MGLVEQLLVASLLACSASPGDVGPCFSREGFTTCGDDVTASLEVTLTDERVLAVPLRRRWVRSEENTTTVAPETTVAVTRPSPETHVWMTTAASTQSTKTMTTSTVASVPDDILYRFEDYYDELDRYPGVIRDFEKAEKSAEEKERKRLAAERSEYVKKYCADQEGDVETTNLQHTGFNVPSNYEVFPGVGIYRFHRAALRWEDARRRCEEEGAHLLVLNSEDEWAVVSSLMRRCPWLLPTHFNYYSYIGVHDMRQEGHFETVLGGRLEDTGYVRWMPNQPDNAHHLGENCLTVSRDGAFNDVPCNTSLPYVCEHNSF